MSSKEPRFPLPTGLTSASPTSAELAAQRPRPDYPVPTLVQKLAAGPLVPRWVNGTGGLTVAEQQPDGTGFVRYLKWARIGSGESLLAEAQRLRWLTANTDHPVPSVLEHIVENGEEVLITAAQPGESAVADQWKENPEPAIRAIAQGLRRLHVLPTEGCPFRWDVRQRIGVIRAQSEHRAGDQRAALARTLAAAVPRCDQPVICHGDACAPNTLVDSRGQFLAHVDVGRLGVADRWADLAVATMALEWNYGAKEEHLTWFWEAYGVEPDQGKLAFYRALWNAE